MPLQRVHNDLYIDFDHLAKVYSERFKRGLPFNRLNHSQLIIKCQETALNEQVNEIERTENKKLNCLNFKKS